MSEPPSGSVPSVGWRDPHYRFLLLLLGVGVAAFWLPRLPGSFWLDETVTAWVADGDLAQVLDRAAAFQATPPAYYVLASAVRLVGGTSELALRIPSLIAMGGALYALYRLGRRLFDPETGVIAAVVLAVWNEGAHLATDARPYALGVVAFIAATLLLVRWLDEGHPRDLIAYVISIALVVHLHYVLALPLLAHAVYLWRRRTDLPSGRALIIGGGAFILLTAPLATTVLRTLDERGALSLGTQTIGSTLLVIAPPVLLVGMTAGIALGVRRIGFAADAPQPRAAALTLAGIWAAAPPLILFLMSWIVGAGVLGPQHVTQSAPAIALLVACAIRRLGPEQARRVVVVSIAIVSLLFGTTYRQYQDDWRGAVARSNALLDASAPVLVRSGLAESRDLDWLTDSGRSTYLLAPVNVYPVEGRPVLLPLGLSAAERRYLESEILPIAGSASRFSVISLSIDDSVLPWLQGRLAASGYVLRRSEMFGSVVFALFERT